MLCLHKSRHTHTNTHKHQTHCGAKSTQSYNFLPCCLLVPEIEPVDGSGVGGPWCPSKAGCSIQQPSIKTCAHNTDRILSAACKPRLQTFLFSQPVDFITQATCGYYPFRFWSKHCSFITKYSVMDTSEIPPRCCSTDCQADKQPPGIQCQASVRVPLPERPDLGLLPSSLSNHLHRSANIPKVVLAYTRRFF